MSDAITNTTALEAHFDPPSDVAVACMCERLDHFHRQFIELCPFICIATADADGRPSVSPKGDAPGFVRILDDRTLLLPDRPGNNKVESFHNLVANPGVALVFMIPGVKETLRVRGRAEIITSPRLLESSRVDGRAVKTGTLITIETVYFHCGKAMIRSKLWQDAYQPKPGSLPTFGQIVKAQAEVDASQEAVEDRIQESYRERLY
ncbi:MAG: MSMEG_1061 family FMN-dependent PPOX-type flavoprotein [Pseudomonadota bacterium]